MAFSHRFEATILREYDVRGIVGKTLSADDAYAVGRGFGSAIVAKGGKTVAAGWDGRLSSPELSGRVIQGLLDCGLDVRKIGVGPTPMLYFAARDLGLDGGVMVTGSHNPPDYNGFKMTLGKASFWGGDIQAMGKACAEGRVASGAGHTSDVAVMESYVARLLRDYPKDGKKLNVVWDAGNGAMGEAMVRVCAKLPGTHTLLNEVIDGRFPVHHPDPTVPKNLVQLIDTVAAKKADLGIAFDGDGDRIGVVDGKGRILWGDQLVAVLASEILARLPGSTIIADVKASQVLFDEIARMGGKPLMWKTGHSIIKTKMAETNAPLAGEMSGHIFFADGWYGFDDAMYAALRLMAILAKAPASLAELRDRLPAVINTPELRFPCSDMRKREVVEEVRARLASAGADVNPVDGVRVNGPDGWWLLRASNTQDVLVARCESKSEAGLARLKAALEAQLKLSNIELPDDASAGH
ncbi:MAG: phosphomannomutase/phosphoglucomutase [Tagaea sp.]|nr:phosphomannomutase/phosphoglucomutase [Tagaea sp.]